MPVVRSNRRQARFLVDNKKRNKSMNQTLISSAKSENPYLKIKGVTKKFGDFTALQDINLEINEGEFICFVGPSGCGKTTLLRAIAGLDVQTFGSIEQSGRDISTLPPSERDFGIVFQSYALFPNMTVFKNVIYGLQNKRVPKEKARQRVYELLNMVSLIEHAKKFPAQLSGGQQQRVALARALATSPGLLLLDEPLSALDAKVRGSLRQEMRDLQTKLGVTTIMVTHDQEEALTMGDRIVVMSDGVIEQVGTPSEIYHKPASLFVADFIGTMNFVPGIVQPNKMINIGTMQLQYADSAQNYRPGSKVMLAFRPESLCFESVVDCVNTIDMEVSRIEFLGSTYRTDLFCNGQNNINLRADIPFALFQTLEMQLGKKVNVTIPKPAIQVFGHSTQARHEN